MRTHRSLVLVTLGTFLLAAGCGLGGPGENNSNDAGPPPRDSGLDATVQGDSEVDQPDAYVPTVRLMTAETLRTEYLSETLGQTYADLRPYETCQAGKVPNATCVPLELVWDGAALVDDGDAIAVQTTTEENPLVLYGTAAMSTDVMGLANAFLGLGYTDVWVLDGGIEAWEAAGYYQDIEYQAIIDRYYPPGDGEWIIDTMDATAFALEHITGAVSLDASDVIFQGELVNGGQALLDLTPVASGDVIISYCINKGCHASVALCEAAEMLGYPMIRHYKEGLEEWRLRGGPTTSDATP